jgi:hypothetical protein
MLILLLQAISNTMMPSHYTCIAILQKIQINTLNLILHSKKRSGNVLKAHFAINSEQRQLEQALSCKGLSKTIYQIKAMLKKQ